MTRRGTPLFWVQLLLVCRLRCSCHNFSFAAVTHKTCQCSSAVSSCSTCEETSFSCLLTSNLFAAWVNNERDFFRSLDTPTPCIYISAKLNCARGSPCWAAQPHKRIASGKSCVPAFPWKSIVASCEAERTSPPSIAFRYHR